MKKKNKPTFNNGTMKHIIVYIVTLLLIYGLSASAPAQSISGPSSAIVNDVDNYSITMQNLILGAAWEVNGGNINSTSLNGTTYTVTVKWTAISNANTVKFKSITQTLATKNVNVTSPPLTAGSIGNAQTVCYNGNPGTITSTGSATGGNGNYSYQWQWKYGVSNSWANVSGATGTTYNPPNQTSTKDFRRRVKSDGQTKYSNTIRITVRPSLNAGSISNAQTVCYNGNPGTLTNTASASGGNGSYYLPVAKENGKQLEQCKRGHRHHIQSTPTLP